MAGLAMAAAAATSSFAALNITLQPVALVTGIAALGPTAGLVGVGGMALVTGVVAAAGAAKNAVETAKRFFTPENDVSKKLSDVWNNPGFVKFRESAPSGTDFVVSYVGGKLVIMAVGYGICWIGFGPFGPIASSFAASIQTPITDAASWFAWLQRAGMIGLPEAVKTAIHAIFVGSASIYRWTSSATSKPPASNPKLSTPALVLIPVPGADETAKSASFPALVLIPAPGADDASLKPALILSKL